ncbi:hypothetical protein RHGRI_024403 [Rhododendron griersonianum]|uniref:Uncharacterized protein n=1 Tax=Rhododendron griersonianum TaxID=479676 RepID=A0AAV6J981_9ERIC|nr:hypothetical protein RHGRI_024403 [Rhododendron griersonianum]
MVKTLTLPGKTFSKALKLSSITTLPSLPSSASTQLPPMFTIILPPRLNLRFIFSHVLGSCNSSIKHPLLNKSTKIPENPSSISAPIASPIYTLLENNTVKLHTLSLSGNFLSSHERSKNSRPTEITAGSISHPWTTPVGYDSRINLAADPAPNPRTASGPGGRIGGRVAKTSK